MEDSNFEELLAAMALGDLPENYSAGTLSDLTRDQKSRVGSVWRDLPDETRHVLVSEAGILAENDISYNFEQLMLVAIDDADPRVRRLAAAGLGESTNRRVTRKLCDHLLNDDEAGVRAAAAASLLTAAAAWLGNVQFADSHREIMDALRTALTEDPSEDVRAQAMVAAATSPESWLIPVLEDAYYGDDQAMRLAAIQAMGMTADEMWLEFLLEQLASDDAEFRAEAAMACGEMGLEDAIEPLAALAGDENEEVMLSSIAAIARIGGSLALAVLSDLKSDPPPGIDLEVLEAAIEEVRESRSAFGAKEAEA